MSCTNFKQCNFEVKVEAKDINKKQIENIMIMINNISSDFINGKKCIIMSLSLMQETCKAESFLNKIENIQICRYDSKGYLFCYEYYKFCKYLYHKIEYNYEGNTKTPLRVMYVYTYDDFDIIPMEIQGD